MDQDQQPLATATELATSRRAFLRRATSAAVAVGGAAVPLAGWATAASAQEPDPEGGNGEEAPAQPEPEAEVETGPGACDIEPVEMTEADEQLVAGLESAELAAVQIYELAEERGQLEPPAAANVADYTSNHSQHAEALRCVRGVESEGEADSAVLDDRSAQITGADAQQQVLEVLRELEETLAATYLAALGQIETPGVAEVLATILPVDCQQAVAWARALNQDLAEYVPALETTEGALSPADNAA